MSLSKKTKEVQCSAATHFLDFGIPMKFPKVLLYGAYLIAVTAGSLLVIEYICQRINSANDVHLPFLRSVSTPAGWITVLDPHLGYAHEDTEIRVQELALRYSWVNGFAIYSKRPLPKLERPVILVLGGSTTDGVWSGHSWPEELAKLLVNHGISGTIVNGGTDGYSTNEELLKLIRDGLEFRPEIIISYGGANDRGVYSKLPHPMVNSYQRQILERLTQPNYSPLFPNSMFLLKKLFLEHFHHPMSYTLGVSSSLTFSQQYERNLVLMHTLQNPMVHLFSGSFSQMLAWTAAPI